MATVIGTCLDSRDYVTKTGNPVAWTVGENPKTLAWEMWQILHRLVVLISNTE